MRRREFIEQALCFGTAFSVPAMHAAEYADIFGEERMRLGVLSDIHVATEEQLPYVEMAFRFFDGWKADAILACGDLADYGLEVELKFLADTWFKVFPDGRRSDGAPMVNLMHYGDHDMVNPLLYVDKPAIVNRWPDREFRIRDAMFTHRKESWERCFKEPWEPIVLKEVKGYPFVLSHFTRGEPGNERGNNVPGLEKFLANLKFDPTKPLFYSQHRIPRNTVCGDKVYGQDDGTTARIFSSYPNLIALCGHAHMNGVYEKSIWQDNFTCIAVPSLRYNTTMGGRENCYSIPDRKLKVTRYMRTLDTKPGHQGFLFRLLDRALVVSRRDLVSGGRLGPDWVVPFASFGAKPSDKPFNYRRRVKTMPVPEFAAGTKVSVLPKKYARDRKRVKHLMTPVEFPPVLAKAAEPRPNDYEVSLEQKFGDKVKVLVKRRVYSPKYVAAEKFDVENVCCLFPQLDFPKDGGTVRFAVRPCNAFGRHGKPIHSDWVDLKEEG